MLILLFQFPSSKALGFTCNGYSLGLKFCYEVNYNVESCTQNYICHNKEGLIDEGEKVTYYPEVSLSGVEYSIINQSNKIYYPGDLYFIYYFKYPSGETSQRNYLWIDNPKINLDKPKKTSFGQLVAETQIGGITIPTNRPGVLELKYAITPQSNFTKIHEIDESLFDTQAIHILSYSEVLTSTFGWISLGLSIILLIITISQVFRERIKAKKEEQNRITEFKVEKEKIKDVFKALYSELDVVSNKKIPMEGNLQWFFKSLEKGKPLHGVWSINLSPYMSTIPTEFLGKDFSYLKKEIVQINQKIEMVNRIVLSKDYRLIKAIKGEKGFQDKRMVDFLKKVLKEIEKRTEKIKKDLRSLF